MKRSTVFVKGIGIFCTAVLLTGTFSGCSKTDNQLNGFFGGQPSYSMELPEGLTDPSLTVPDATTSATTAPVETAPVTTAPVDTTPATTAPVPEETLPPETEPVTTPPKPEMPAHPSGEITASVLNIREQPGTDYEIVRGLERGTRVMILEQTTVNGEVWGRVPDGWISMKYVALDGVIDGSWYELVDVEEDAYIYRIWDFHSDNTFVYTKCSLKPEEEYSISRTKAQGGGRYWFDGETLYLELTHGDRVIVCGGYVDVSGSTTVEADIYGATMTWDTHYAELTRGSLETIQKKLRKP